MILKSFQFTKLILFSFLTLSLIEPMNVVASSQVKKTEKKEDKSNPKKRVATEELEGNKKKISKYEEKSLSSNEVRTLLNQNEGKDVLEILKNEDISTSTIKELLAQNDEVGKRIAFSIAKSIFLEKLENPSIMNRILGDILKDHSEQHEVSDRDSYFRTNNEDEIFRIIRKTINDPQSYSYRSNTNKCEFAVIREFSTDDNLKYIGKKNLGYDNAKKNTNNPYVNHAFVCFGINGVIKESGKNSWSGKTSINTAYPKDF